MWSNKLDAIIRYIDDSILEDADNVITNGNIIKASYDADVSKYRKLIQNSKDWLDNYRAELIEKTWITTLRIKYNWNSGYFIEISKSQTENILETFQHKQTLVNASRYITPELLNFQDDVLHAEDKMAAKEYEIFEKIRKDILESSSEIRDVSSKIAEIDVQVWLSECAYQNNYTRPVMTESYDLDIVWGRHPVIETMGADFISNDLKLTKKVFNHIITWPNMWWKSTFLRQNSLIILMAHIGSFIPAKNWSIPLTDRLFSRVWASDNLFLWQSTFMVEMQEIAYILNNATEKSFVIIDEVGRGTSTYDGMSLAWAILKENHDIIGAKTLFSTHYHEICEEWKALSWVKNFSVAVWENEENIVFLRKIVPGAMYKSFGIEVAKLAWINKRVLKESRKMLEKLQNQEMQQLSLEIIEKKEELENTDERVLSKKLEAIDINSLTPMEALVQLHELQKSNY